MASRVLLVGVGVVEAQVAETAVFESHSEVEAERLCVPDVQAAVGFGGKARVDGGRRESVFYVLGNDLPNEMHRFVFRFFNHIIKNSLLKK